MRLNPLNALTVNEKKTYIRDSLRALPEGFVIGLTQTFFLYIAIAFFDASDFAKSLISAGQFIGFFAAIFSGYVLGRLKKASAAALLTFLGSVFVILTGCVNNTMMYVGAVVISGVLLYLRPPLFTAVYQENYRRHHLGRLFSAFVFLSTVSGLIAGSLIGFILERDIALFRPVFIVSGASLLLTSYLVYTIPSTEIQREDGAGFVADLSLLVKDRVFGRISFSWFLMGFANLWTLPLRVVYLAESGRGLGLSPLTVSIMMGIVPNATRLLMNRVWAVLFDKIGLLYYRILVNVFIGTGILLFFSSRNLITVNIGNVLVNIGLSGSPFIWNLWVNKIAPPGESHRYMSVHTFLAGIRGIMAPFLGFMFIQSFSLRTIGFASAGLILLSILLLLPLISTFQSVQSSN